MVAEQCSDLVRPGEVDVNFFWSKSGSDSSVRRSIVHAIVEPRAQDASEESSNVPSWLEQLKRYRPRRQSGHRPDVHLAISAKHGSSRAGPLRDPGQTVRNSAVNLVTLGSTSF